MKILALILFIFSFEAHSYHSEVHGRITSGAYQIIERCFPGDFRVSQQDLVARGSVEEDTTQGKLRYTNWHFYNTYGNLRQGPIFFESLDRIFKMRNGQYAQLYPESALGSHTLGRVLHYIQDMYVPAHVVPIFHGKPFAKLDPFDHFHLSADEENEITAQVNCLSVVNEVDRLTRLQKENKLSRYQINRKILDEAAAFTLSRINSQVGDQNITWRSIWRAPESRKFDLLDTVSSLVAVGVKSKRFGRYLGQFGQDMQLLDRDGRPAKITAQDSSLFYKEQLRSALSASAVFIVLNEKE